MGAITIEIADMGDELPEHNTIIVGLGKTGLSCARYLSSRGLSFAVMDSRDQPPELERLRELFPETPLYLGALNQAVLSNTDQLILSPGLSKKDPAIATAERKGVKITGDIELFIQQATAPVIAVTGSNGKSTVASLISAMIEQAGLRVLLGGNIGTPALDLLLQDKPDYYVLELSSFQLELVSGLNAVASVVLNVSSDHMDRYPDIDTYAAAKRRIYRGDGTKIVNRDDDFSSAMTGEGWEVIFYSLNPPVSENEFGVVIRNGQPWLMQGREYLLPVSDLKLDGKHNISNALAALALGHAVDLPIPAMLAALKSFAGLPHRCQRIACINGVEWINDSKGTNVGATLAAITGLGGEKDLILIAGGDGKNADFSILSDAVEKHVTTAILIGRDANRMASALDGCTRILHATSLESAVQTAAKIALPGNRVLLSPACASFDMFRDYQERGEVFVRAVNALIGSGTDS